MVLLLLHGAEQHVGAHGLGYEVGRVQHLPQRAVVVHRTVEQVFARAQNADYVVYGLVVHRDARQPRFADGLKNFLVGCVVGQRHHVGAVGHHVKGRVIVELEYVVDHLALGLGDGTLFLADVRHDADVLFGHFTALGVRINVHQPQHAVGGDRQQPNQRLCDHGKPQQHVADHFGHRFGFLHRHALGHQLAEYQRKVGENDGDQYDTDGIEDFCIHRRKRGKTHQPFHQRPCEVIRCKCRAQEAGKRDGNLDGGQKAGGRGYQLEHAHRVLVAVLGLQTQLVLVQGEYRNLRCGKECVDGDEYDLQNQLPPYRVHKEFPL